MKQGQAFQQQPKRPTGHVSVEPIAPKGRRQGSNPSALAEDVDYVEVK